VPIKPRTFCSLKCNFCSSLICRERAVTRFSQRSAPVCPRKTCHRRPMSMACPAAPVRLAAVPTRTYPHALATGCHFARSKNLSAAARQAHSWPRVAQALARCYFPARSSLQVDIVLHSAAESPERPRPIMDERAPRSRRDIPGSYVNLPCTARDETPVDNPSILLRM